MPNSNRRQILKGLGTGITGLALAGNVEGSEESPSTDFDPTKREEVLRFLYETFEYSSSHTDNDIESLRATLHDRLSSEQKESIGEAWEEDIRFKVEKTGHSNAGASANDETAQSWSSYDYIISTSITVPLCPTFPPGCYEAEFDAYNFQHELQWFYSNGEVTSGTATVDGSGANYAAVYWDYEGVTGSEMELHPDGYYVATWREGRFDQHILVDQSPTVHQYPSCWVQGDNNGYGSAYDIEYK